MRPAPKRSTKHLQRKSSQARPTRRPPVLMAGGTCHYCSKEFERLTRDHVVPRSRGGADMDWNIVLACHACNNLKASEWPVCQCEFCLAAISRQTRARRSA